MLIGQSKICPMCLQKYTGRFLELAACPYCKIRQTPVDLMGLEAFLGQVDLDLVATYWQNCDVSRELRLRMTGRIDEMRKLQEDLRRASIQRGLMS